MTPVSSARLRGLHDRFHPAATSRRAITLATSGASTGAVARRLLPRNRTAVYPPDRPDILLRMAKHLVDIDEDILRAARDELGTKTIKDTVNLALRHVGAEHRTQTKRRLDVLARAGLAAREQAWR